METTVTSFVVRETFVDTVPVAGRQSPEVYPDT